MLSQTAEYALRAVLAIAQTEQEEGRAVRATELAAQLRVPANYLSKTLHGLARAGVLHSTRGRRGGFRLARPPEAISLLDVVARFDDIRAERRCLLGRGVCSDQRPCVIHDHWRAVSTQVAEFFAATTLAAVTEPERVSVRKTGSGAKAGSRNRPPR